MKSRICPSLMLVSGMLFPGMAMAKETIYYFHNDHLGTPQAMSDQSGTIVWKAEYEPFGTAVVDEDPDSDGIAVTCNLRFPGQYYDAESGLHYNYHRDYDPSTGRYVEPDPIGINAGTDHPYGYAKGNSLAFADSTGLKVEIIIGRRQWYPTSFLASGQDFIPFVVGTIDAFSDRCETEPVSGYTLERIDLIAPTGTFAAFLRTDHNPARIELRAVPGRTNIQIHTGNTPDDSLGCILVGERFSTGSGLPFGVFLYNSNALMADLLDLVAADGSSDISVTIRDAGIKGFPW